ncbi:MAG: ribonucleoside triphosphate reductase, partial [Eggerthellaceae bacterium]|nr:ribonucleoside triphosphate reductase [Eggerthellaceae bacterium]
AQGAEQEAAKQEPTESKAAEQVAAPAIQETEIPLVEAALKPGLYLVATHTCPNCHFAAAQLDKAGIQYETLYAEENQELIKHFNLMQAPSLIKVSSAGEVETFGGAATVFKEISELMAVAR